MLLDLIQDKKTLQISYWGDGGKTFIETVEIKDGITSIENSSFSYCYKVKSITIPESVKSIKDNVFWCCYNLNSIKIPNNVTHIGEDAFGCSGLTTIDLPKIKLKIIAT